MMVDGDTSWKQEVVEWCLDCLRKGEVPDLPTPYSEEEEKVLKPTCNVSKLSLIEQRISKSRMAMQPINVCDLS